VRDPHRLIIGEVQPQTMGDLLRTPRVAPTPILAPAMTTADPPASIVQQGRESVGLQ